MLQQFLRHSPKLGLLFPMAILIVSCEEPVELDIEVPRSQLVIHSNFFPDEAVSLQVSATGILGSPAIPLPDARVSLFEGTELAEELTYEEGDDISGRNGRHVTKTFVPRVGRKYTVHVSADGYDPVTAVSSIPEPVDILSLQITGLSQLTDGPFTTYDYHLRVDYDDPRHEINFYDLLVYQEVIPYQIAYNGDTVFQKRYLVPVGTPQQASQLGQTLSVLLQDKLGREYIEVHLQTRLNNKREILGEVVAELRTVSPEYYRYRRSLDQSTRPGLPGVTEPVILFDNVERGLGVFAGYTSVKQQLSFSK
jgi:hypothetical protein